MKTMKKRMSGAYPPLPHVPSGHELTACFRKKIRQHMEDTALESQCFLYQSRRILFHRFIYGCKDTKKYGYMPLFPKIFYSFA